MTEPAAPSSLSSTLTAPAHDILWGRPQFRPPSLDRLLEMLDFSAFSAELTRACGFGPREPRPVSTTR